MNLDIRIFWKSNAEFTTENWITRFYDFTQFRQKFLCGIRQNFNQRLSQMFLNRKSVEMCQFFIYAEISEFRSLQNCYTGRQVLEDAIQIFMDEFLLVSHVEFFEQLPQLFHFCIAYFK